VSYLNDYQCDYCFNINISNYSHGILENVSFTSNISNDYNNSFEDIFSFSNLNIRDWTLHNQGALLVVMDMSLAIVSVVFNLMGITAIKEQEEMLGITFNLVLINLCSSNLLSAVMVKSISIVHNAYAVAANTPQSNVAFCILYSFGHCLTLSVLPWSVVVLCWLTALPRIRRLQVMSGVLSSICQVCLFQVHFAQPEQTSALPSVSGLMESKEGEEIEMHALQHGTCSVSLAGSTMTNDRENNPGMDDDDDAQLLGGLSMSDKGILGTIWGVSSMVFLQSKCSARKLMFLAPSVIISMRTLVLPPSSLLSSSLPSFDLSLSQSSIS
jgi:hypothetical protein